MIEPIIPAILQAQAGLKAKPAADRDGVLDAAVRQNILRTVNRLRTTETLLAEPIKSKRLMIVGARYDLDDGRVEFLES